MNKIKHLEHKKNISISADFLEFFQKNSVDMFLRSDYTNFYRINFNNLILKEILMADTIDFDFDKYNPIRREESKITTKDILKKFSTIEMFCNAVDSALKDELSTSEVKFLEDLSYNSSNYYKLMAEVKGFYDTVVKESTSYVPNEENKDLTNFFNALFDYLKKDGNILWLYAKEVARSSIKIRTNDEFLELFRQSFLNDCKRKQPTDLASSYTVYKTFFYQSDDEDPVSYKSESYVYPGCKEYSSKGEALYNYYDTYMRKLFTNMTTAIRHAKS